MPKIRNFMDHKNIILVATCGCFLMSLSFIIHESIKNPSVTFLHSPVITTPEDFSAYFYVLYLMAGSGFLMMVLLTGALLNASRINKKLKKVHDILLTQMKAVECSRDGIGILDHDGNYIYMNQAHARCYGYHSAQGLIGKNWKDLYDVEASLHFEKEIFPVLFKKGWWSGVSKGRKMDGTYFPQEVSLSSLPNGGLICVVRDISEKIAYEEKLEIIQRAVEAANDGIAITDSENRLLFMNESFLRIHGIPVDRKDDLMGADWRSVYNKVGQDHINTEVLPTTILKGTWMGSLQVMRKSGDVFYGDAMLTRLKDGQILGVMRDVSERRKSELESLALQEELARSKKMEAVARLAEAMTSDFGNIIKTIQSEARQLQKKINQRNLQASIDEIVHSADKADILVGQLLAFNQKKNIKLKLIDVKECIDITRNLFKDEMSEDHDFVASLKSNDAYIYANPEQVLQILKHVCSNAFESMNGIMGKVAITLKDADRMFLGIQRHIVSNDIPIRAVAAMVRKSQIGDKNYLFSGYLLRGRRYLQISISDNGTGIPPEALPNVFDPFFTTKKKGSITGLGLSNVHGAVIAAKGAIVLETVEGVGTTVHLFFPRSEVLELRQAEALLEAV